MIVLQGYIPAVSVWDLRRYWSRYASVNYLRRLIKYPKNGPTKDTKNIGYRECGKNKVFFYIEVYNDGTEQKHAQKMDDLRCENIFQIGAGHGITS